MAEVEGVIRFDYALQPPSRPIDGNLAQSLLAWRTMLRRLELLGQRPDRYGGLGYGNLSRRVPSGNGAFIITASQTSGIAEAGLGELVRVNRCSFDDFQMEAEGRLPPSSEAMTHAMVYAADPSLHWVLHGHSPEIWRNAAALGLPAIAADVEYGSRSMVAAVAALLNANPARPLVFVTLGHEDGVFACGGQVEPTGADLIVCLGRSLALAKSGASAS